MTKLEIIVHSLNSICSWFSRQSNFDFWNIWNFWIKYLVVVFDYDQRPSAVATGAGHRHKSNDNWWSPSYLYQAIRRSPIVTDKQKHAQNIYEVCIGLRASHRTCVRVEFPTIHLPLCLCCSNTTKYQYSEDRVS